MWQTTQVLREQKVVALNNILAHFSFNFPLTILSNFVFCSLVFKMMGQIHNAFSVKLCVPSSPIRLNFRVNWLLTYK
jgi:hypothetical protein